jgi:dynein heavy chain
MDERHWWIAQKIAQAFSIDSSSGFLEKFICEPDHLELINNFLCMNGINKLFFYNFQEQMTSTSTAISTTSLNTNSQVIFSITDIAITDNILKMPKQVRENADNTIILYFVRHDTIQEVSQTQIHKEVFCGEIKNASQILFNVYNDLLFKMFVSNKNWGHCNETNKLQSIRNMEKYVTSLSEFSSESSHLKNMMLKRVDSDILLELKQARFANDSPIIKYCEDLATDWMQTIEHILSDICDERFIHRSIGPSSELERWQRKQRLLSNLTEQLKTKECKSVMSALITAKSKVLKKWKIIDTG